MCGSSDLSYLTRCYNWTRSLLFSFIKRSFKAHASISISNLESSLEFYQKLGFRRVTSTRAAEVVLIRNHHGDEINLIPRSSVGVSKPASSRVLLEVGDLAYEMKQIELWYTDAKIISSPVSKRAEIIDPDGNTIELNELLNPKQRPTVNIYHLATHAELVAGLSEHYYLPPAAEKRFVRARPHSAFVSLACYRIAQEVNSAPLVIEMDAQQLSVEEQFLVESDFDSRHVKDELTYPRVNSPITRTAIVSVGKCVEDNGDFPWPKEFYPLSSIV